MHKVSTLVQDTDYTITYFEADNNELGSTFPTAVGSYRSVVYAKDGSNYTGKESGDSFTIAPEPEEIKYYAEVPMTVNEVKDITGTKEATAETNPYDTKIVNSASLETLLKVTATEKTAGVNVWLDVKDGALTVPATDKEKIQSNAGDFTVGQYLDIKLFKKVGNAAPVAVHETNGKVKAAIVIPTSLRKPGRTFRVGLCS